MADYFTSFVPASLADYVDKFKNAFVAAGWTLEDTVGANDYVLYNEGGESGKFPFYLRMKVLNTYRLDMKGYWTWDSGTSTGTREVGRDYFSGLQYAAGITDFFINYISVNKDTFAYLVPLNSSYYSGGEGGLFYPFLATSEDRVIQVATLTNPSGVTAGADIVLEVDDNSIFEVGFNYFIRSEGDFDKFICSAKDTGEITANSLSNAYPNGAIIGANPLPFVVPGTYYNQVMFIALGPTGYSSDNSNNGKQEVGTDSFNSQLYTPDDLNDIILLYPRMLYQSHPDVAGTRGLSPGRFFISGLSPVSLADTMNVREQVLIGAPSGPTQSVWIRQF